MLKKRNKPYTSTLPHIRVKHSRFKKMKNFRLFLLAFLLLGCANKKEKLITLNGLAFGTTYKIEYYDFGTDSKIKKGIDFVVRAINKSLSTYLPESDISEINKGNTPKI